MDNNVTNMYKVKDNNHYTKWWTRKSYKQWISWMYSQNKIFIYLLQNAYLSINLGLPPVFINNGGRQFLIGRN